MKTELERQYIAIKKWNERRAKNEAKGLQKFYSFRELWKAEKQKTANKTN